jgi:hypothetical protein
MRVNPTRVISSAKRAMDLRMDRLDNMARETTIELTRLKENVLMNTSTLSKLGGEAAKLGEDQAQRQAKIVEMVHELQTQSTGPTALSPPRLNSKTHHA